MVPQTGWGDEQSWNQYNGSLQYEWPDFLDVHLWFERRVERFVWFGIK